MKAIVYTTYGPPEVLELREVEKPVPGDHEILVRVRATTVNRTDCHNLSGKPYIMRFPLGIFKPGKSIMGTEFAGDIEAIGGKVNSFKTGDRIFGFDDLGIGAYAEYMVIPENNGFLTIPDNITYEQAAASTEGAHYAYNFMNKVTVNKGDKVLVNGASGGIGSAAVQLLAFYGAEVTGVCNTKNLELVKTLGAKKVIDYLKEDFTKDTVQYDFIFDTAGKSSFGKCKRLLKSGGVYMSSELGTIAQNLFFALFSAIFGSLPFQKGKKVKFPYPPDIKRSLHLIRNLMEKGKFNPVIDRSYRLEEIAEAFRYVGKGQKTGNVVITI
jgi:NADPH:quinone reductase-like Zn-dependent oxidoreductase